MTSWRYAASSDVGLVRDENEDAVHVDDRLVVVADGMGGHAAGEVASKLAVEEICRDFEQDASGEGLVRAIRRANQTIIADAAEHPERLGMGTTVVVLALTKSGEGLLPVLVNVGDSRAYQLRDGAMRQLTVDHSVAEEWVRQGRLTPEEALVHPRRHQLTRTLGVEPEVDPDVFAVAVEPGDRLLLCSDGLSNELSDDQIAEVASSPNLLDDAAAKLVELANRHGGRDNISVVLVEFDEVSATPPSPGLVGAGRNALPAPPQPVRAAPIRASARPRSKVSWRMLAFVTALASTVALAVIVLGWYEKSNYYLASSRGFVAVYQGQPHGVLWFKPMLVVTTDVPVSQIRLADQQSLTHTISEPTVGAAVNFATYMHTEWQIQHGGTTTTTTVPVAGG